MTGLERLGGVYVQGALSEPGPGAPGSAQREGIGL